MKKQLLGLVATVAITAGSVGVANAAPLPDPAVHNAAFCAASDIGLTVTACEGFYNGQLLSGSPNAIADATRELSELGFAWDGSTIYDSVSGLNGADPVLSKVLNGITYLAIHWGGGVDAPDHGQDTTSFYKVDAGNSNILTFALNLGSSSDVTIYGTSDHIITHTGGVPEPATWAMMLVGFGGMGAMLRRRRTLAVA